MSNSTVEGMIKHFINLSNVDLGRIEEAINAEKNARLKAIAFEAPTSAKNFEAPTFAKKPEVKPQRIEGVKVTESGAKHPSTGAKHPWDTLEG